MIPAGSAEGVGRGAGLVTFRRLAKEPVDQREPAMSGRVLTITLLVVTGPALLLFRGSGELASRVLWGSVALAVLVLVAQGRRNQLLAVIMAVLPFMSLLRGFLFFHVIGVLVGGALFYWFARERGAWAAFRRTHPLVLWLAALVGIYYLASFAATGDYSVNLRLMECVLGAVLVLVLVRDPATFAGALGGLVASVCLLGASMLPHLQLEGANARLGMIELDDVTLGNPIQLGLPVALCVLALVVDRGFWMGLLERKGLRTALLVPIVTVLLLTTSRTSWFIAAVGLAVQLAFARRARAGVVVAIGVGLVALNVILASPLGDSMTASLNRTFSEERSARNRTSGRSDQWVVAYHAVTQSPATFLFGYGPGSGPQVYARKSLELSNVAFGAGSELYLHSLYMQVAVEVGMVGLLPLLIVLALAGRRIVVWTSTNGRMLPLAAFAGYLIIAGTISGGDMSSGAFLGLGLVGAIRSRTSALGRRAAATPLGGQSTRLTE